jgi:hypothetical protein
MKRSIRGVLLVAMLGTTAVATSGCDPAGAEAWGRFAIELSGSILAVALAVIVVIASIPPL